MFSQAIAAIARAVLRPPALLLGSILGFGVLIPHRMGLLFTESRMLLAYAFLPMLFVAAPLAMGMPFARTSVRRLYTWIAAGIVWGLCLWLVLLLAALVTVTVAMYPAPPRYPAPVHLAGYALVCAGSCWAAGVVAAYLAMLFRPEVARNVMRAGFLLLLLWAQYGTLVTPPRLRWYASGISVGHIAAGLGLLALGITNALRAGVHENSAQTSE